MSREQGPRAAGMRPAAIAAGRRHGYLQIAITERRRRHEQGAGTVAPAGNHALARDGIMVLPGQ